jgi:hypothetical protein
VQAPAAETATAAGLRVCVNGLRRLCALAGAACALFLLLARGTPARGFRTAFAYAEAAMEHTDTVVVCAHARTHARNRCALQCGGTGREDPLVAQQDARPCARGNSPLGMVAQLAERVQSTSLRPPPAGPSRPPRPSRPAPALPSPSLPSFLTALMPTRPPALPASAEKIQE